MWISIKTWHDFAYKFFSENVLIECVFHLKKLLRPSTCQEICQFLIRNEKVKKQMSLHHCCAKRGPLSESPGVLSPNSRLPALTSHKSQRILWALLSKYIHNVATPHHLYPRHPGPSHIISHTCSPTDCSDRCAEDLGQVMSLFCPKP